MDAQNPPCPPLSRRAIAFRTRSAHSKSTGHHQEEDQMMSTQGPLDDEQIDVETVVTTDERSSSNVNSQMPLATIGQTSDVIALLRKIYHSAMTPNNSSTSDSDVKPAAHVKDIILKLVETDMSVNEFLKSIHQLTSFTVDERSENLLATALPGLRVRFAASTRRAKLFDEIFNQDFGCNEGEDQESTDRDDDEVPSVTGANGNSRKRNSVDRLLNTSTADVSKRSRLSSVVGMPQFVPTTLSLPRLDIGVSAPSSSSLLTTMTTINGTTTTTARVPSRPGLTAFAGAPFPTDSAVTWAPYAEEWRNIENIFTTLATSVERLRYSMLTFQQRVRLGQAWAMQQQQLPTSAAMQEVQRKADVAVQQVKKIAVQELQNAVSAAERRAVAMVAAERMHAERTMTEANRQEDCVQNCWNCGRRAGQACSGCGVARYCGSFCQHKDWKRHQLTCKTSTSTSSGFNRNHVLSPVAGEKVALKSIHPTAKLEHPSPPERSTSPPRSPKSV